MEYITKISERRVLLPFDVENGEVYAIRRRDRKRIIILNGILYDQLRGSLTEPGRDYLAGITFPAKINSNCLCLSNNFVYTSNIVNVRRYDNGIRIKFLRGSVDILDTHGRQNRDAA